ncbi:MAG TPA: alkaline phosphatase family protein [Chloroflexota bacterium]|nr:alkaline phosphatase family protein [Chloroflexota bacterium]
MRLSLRGTIAALKAAAALRRLRLPFSEIERRRRGFVLIQIDALSHEDLLRALDRGYMPHLKQLLSTTHRVDRWRCGIPSDTAAIQCSLMYGRKSDIPGFYWLDREQGKPVICSWPLDMNGVETRNAGSRPGLFRRGSVYMGMATGGAQRAPFTTSAIGRTSFPPRLTGIDALALLVLHPWRLGRAAALTVAEVFIELWQTLWARLHGRYVTPEGVFPITRAFTHVLFRELATLGIRLDIFRGVPAIYANYIGYDGVAHHTGPRSPEAYRALKALDRQVRDIKRAIDTIALRPYDVYIMSDHGMTESRPFDYLHGESLAQFISRYAVRPAADLSTREHRDRAAFRQVEELAAELGPKTTSLMSHLADRGMRLAMRLGTGPLQAGLSDADAGPVLAIYSSALANVYFTDVDHRPDLSEIERAAPDLMAHLADHPGVGLVIARDGGKTIALHGGHRAVLEDADVVDLSFLAEYDDPALLRPQLIHLARMPSAGDLVVFGAYNGTRVVSFEQHAGAHGGLGGPQQFPFMIVPRDAGLEFGSVTDATQLNEMFARRYRLLYDAVADGPATPSVAAR